MCFFFGCWIFFSKRERGKFTRNTEIGHEVRIHLSLRDKFDLNFSKKKKLLLLLLYLFLLKNLFFFNNHFPKFLEIFHHFTVDSMKASITHDFGCYIQFPNSSIRIGVQVIGIFVPRKRNKTRENWNKNFKMKERGIKYSSRVVQTD